MHMWAHYIKVAVRNLWKYRLQNFISIFGLSLGFACFALASLWIRYELTYDAFHHGADRILQVYVKSSTEARGMSSGVPYLTGEYMAGIYPEIEQFCTAQFYENRYKNDGIQFSTYQVAADTSFLSFWKIRILSGSNEFVFGNGENIAVTQELAHRLWPGEDPVGKELEEVYTGQKKTICAVVTGWSEHSNFPFEIIEPLTDRSEEWYVYNWHCFIRLKRGTDHATFLKKVESSPKKIDHKDIHWILIPLQSVRYLCPQKDPVIGLNQVRLFALAGALVVLCALLNYGGLFISQMKNRTREMSLRAACGSSGWGLLRLVMTEFLILLILAASLGMLFIEVTLPRFKELAGIRGSDGFVYTESVVYILFIIILAFFCAGISLYSFRGKLRKPSTHRSSTLGIGLPRKVSIVIQFIISIGFMYCTVIMMNQLHYLFHKDIGISRENRGAIIGVLQSEAAPLATKLRQLPMINELHSEYSSLLPLTTTRFHYSFNDWQGKGSSPDIKYVQLFIGSREYIEFYELTLLSGTIPDLDTEQNQILINETFARGLNISDPVGLKIRNVNHEKVYKEYIITGVLKDFSIYSPAFPVKPILITLPASKETIGKNSSFESNLTDLLFKYQEGTWPECKAGIKEILEKEFPDLFYVSFTNMENSYAEYLRSDRILLYLLGIVSGICILISLFGVYSLVSLSCEKRRKEIAIRKVNGASTGTILWLFIHEYLSLLVLAALIAFPISFLIMKNWSETYATQAETGVWIYPFILVIMGIAIGNTIGWRVGRAARQNPAEVIKSE